MEPGADIPARYRAVHAKWPLVVDRLHFGGVRVEHARPADPDGVLDAVCAEEERRRTSGETFDEPLRMPYWAAVWESAAAVGHHLAESFAPARPWRETEVLDLGCGTGLAGLVAAALGARVTLADIEADAVDVARANVEPFADRCTVRKLDWNADRLPGRFDLILGSDVLYEVEQWEGVERFLRSHLAQGGVALVGEPGRTKAETYVPWITARGWRVEETSRPIGPRVVRLLQLRLLHAQ